VSWQFTKLSESKEEKVTGTFFTSSVLQTSLSMS
jgi:hypothetical protein